MSPFARQLKKIRTEKQLQQKTMAETIGCEQSYLSALETDAKVPPQGEKLLQLIKKLKLTVEEESALLAAAEQSRRFIRLPLRAPTQLFEICHALEDQLPYISEVQLQLIGIALSIDFNERRCQKLKGQTY